MRGDPGRAPRPLLVEGGEGSCEPDPQHRVRHVRPLPPSPSHKGTGRCLALLLLAAPALWGGPARADSPAIELSGLFIQGCLNFAGDPAGLRAWAQREKLPTLPEPARLAFLHGAPGTAFDASAGGDKLVLVSADDGICTAVTNRAHGPAVAEALEADLRKLGIRFRLVIERNSTHNAALHFREYLAARLKRAWRIQAATINGAKPGVAMLTAAPE